jgi:hypothetical protein
MRRGTGVSPATCTGTKIVKLENSLSYFLDVSKVGLGDATNTSWYTVTGRPSQGILRLEMRHIIERCAGVSFQPRA